MCLSIKLVIWDFPPRQVGERNPLKRPVFVPINWDENRSKKFRVRPPTRRGTDYKYPSISSAVPFGI